MTISPDSLSALKERIRLMLSNRLTYPKILLSIAHERILTKEEIEKAQECLEACRQLIDAELTIYINRPQA